MDFITQNWAWVLGCIVVLSLIFIKGRGALISYKNKDEKGAISKVKGVIKTIVDGMILLNSDTKLENKAKMDSLVDDLYASTPDRYKKFLTKKVIRFFCQAIYNRLKGKIDIKSKHNELLYIISSELAEDVAKNVIEQYSEKLINTDYNGRMDIVGNDTIQDFAVESKNNIQLKLKAEARAMFDEKLKASGLLGLELTKRF